MQCTSPIRIRNGTFPCGKCLNCRIAKAREWSARLMHELGSWNCAVFVTLTYSDYFLPEDFGLHKEDLRNFFKRLRKRLGVRKIKYYACGEYGDHPKNKDGSWKFPTHLGRPHYHAIIFGLGRDTESKELVKHSWRFCEWLNFNDKKAFGTVTYDSCRYVSDYIFKKYYKQKEEEVYTSKGVVAPFKVCSQGLGLEYCMKEAENLKFNFGFTMRGVKMALPRYYVEKLGLKLEDQNEARINALAEYALKHDIASCDIQDTVESFARQRALTTEARLNLHKKGSL